MGSSGNVCGENMILNGYYVSGYKKNGPYGSKINFEVINFIVFCDI